MVIDANDLKPVNPSAASNADKKARAEAARKANEAADAAEAAAARADKRRKAQAFASAFTNLRGSLSPSVLVKTSGGVGGGGPMSVNYSSIIFSKYYNAWVAPLALGDDTPVVVVRITIDRDGNVKASHIVRLSGNKLMDRSVQNVLENVSFIEPFPDSSTEREKTVTIEFNLEAKRQSA